MPGSLGPAADHVDEYGPPRTYADLHYLDWLAEQAVTENPGAVDGDQYDLDAEEAH